MSTILFDESLSKFCQVIVDGGGEEILKAGAFSRDHVGRLQLVVKMEAWDEGLVIGLRPVVSNALGKYSQLPPDNIIRDTDSPLVNEWHLALPERILVNGEEREVSLVDKRAAGQDWLRRPVIDEQASTPRMVFWSLKGGVGRTTALVALATSLARKGANVLVVDMDLEAPGVGDQLLRPAEKPAFGVLDYLIEGGVGNRDMNDILKDVVGVSTLITGAGLIHVCPAAGRVTNKNPGNYLAKLFRAYRAEGADASLSVRVSKLIESLVGMHRYDAVLIDARAGLNESTAAAVLGLNADVLLFGHNTPQTFSGYRYALSHFSRFILDGDGEWRLKLKMVHAKASAKLEEQDKFRDESFEVFSEWLYEDGGDFSFGLIDEEAPHAPWVVLDDSNFRDFDPIGNPGLLDGPVFQAVFGEFIEAARERLRIE